MCRRQPFLPESNKTGLGQFQGLHMVVSSFGLCSWLIGKLISVEMNRVLLAGAECIVI